MSTREKLNKKIARQIRKEIAEAIHASAERIAELRRRNSQNQQGREISCLLPANKIIPCKNKALGK